MNLYNKKYNFSKENDKKWASFIYFFPIKTYSDKLFLSVSSIIPPVFLVFWVNSKIHQMGCYSQYFEVPKFKGSQEPLF